MSLTVKHLDAILLKRWEGLTEEQAHMIGFEIASHCHPRTGVTVRYWGGELYLVCRRCQTPLMEIAVARENTYD